MPLFYNIDNQIELYRHAFFIRLLYFDQFLFLSVHQLAEERGDRKYLNGIQGSGIILTDHATG